MKTILLLIAFILLVALAVVWDIATYNECRDFGHSWWYCLNI